MNQAHSDNIYTRWLEKATLECWVICKLSQKQTSSWLHDHRRIKRWLNAGPASQDVVPALNEPSVFGPSELLIDQVNRPSREGVLGGK